MNPIEATVFARECQIELEAKRGSYSIGGTSVGKGHVSKVTREKIRKAALARWAGKKKGKAA